MAPSSLIVLRIPSKRVQVGNFYAAETGEEVDMAAKMSQFQVHDIKQPRLRRLSRSKCPEPVLLDDAFVFEPSMPYRDLGAVELQTDDTKQQPNPVPERSNYMSPAFTFKFPIRLQGLVSESYPAKLGRIDVAAKMAGWPTYVDKHSPKPVPQNLEHVAPSGSFTFTSTTRKPDLGPVEALQYRKGIDVAAEMAELQVRDINQPRLSRTNLPEHVVPNTAFIFERPIWSRDLEVDKASKMPKFFNCQLTTRNSCQRQRQSTQSTCHRPSNSIVRHIFKGCDSSRISVRTKNLT